MHLFGFTYRQILAVAKVEVVNIDIVITELNDALDFTLRTSFGVPYPSTGHRLIAVGKHNVESKFKGIKLIPSLQTVPLGKRGSGRIGVVFGVCVDRAETRQGEKQNKGAKSQ
ncbi:MAG: hypothetical protein AAF593_14115 [Planctomycetota bacterium]